MSAFCLPTQTISKIKPDSYIRDRLLYSKQSGQLLKLYRQILDREEVIAVDSSEEKELLLSGLVVKQEGILKVHNRIYKSIFV